MTDNETIREQYERETGHPYQIDHETDTGLTLMDVFWITVSALILALVIYAALELTA